MLQGRESIYARDVRQETCSPVLIGISPIMVRVPSVERYLSERAGFANSDSEQTAGPEKEKTGSSGR
jgi:hypothetical protein